MHHVFNWLLRLFLLLDWLRRFLGILGRLLCGSFLSCGMGLVGVRGCMPSGLRGRTHRHGALVECRRLWF